MSINFYSHAHAGRDVEKSEFYSPFGDFYSHAHAGRDYYWVVDVPAQIISTHTPTQGVTLYDLMKQSMGAFLLTRPRRA